VPLPANPINPPQSSLIVVNPGSLRPGNARCSAIGRSSGACLYKCGTFLSLDHTYGVLIISRRVRFVSIGVHQRAKLSEFAVGMLCSRGSHFSRLRFRAFLFAIRGTCSEDFRRWMIAAPSGPSEADWRRTISTDSALLIRHTFFGGRGRPGCHPRRLISENQLVAQFLDSVKQAVM